MENWKFQKSRKSLVYDGNQTLTLTLVWQLMRSYTLSVLAQYTQSGDSFSSDKDIVKWVIKKLSKSGKQTSIRSFQDPAISKGQIVLDLIGSIKPNVIDHSLIKNDGSNENKMSNAKYAVTCVSMGTKSQDTFITESKNLEKY